MRLAALFLTLTAIFAAVPAFAHERHSHHHFRHRSVHHRPAPVIVPHDDNPAVTPGKAQCPHPELLCE
jgi:hypothetical protein